mmetsp:Transcript_19649/g.29830  ORF Transcript_19649/g.29830 Transcript_19649/m.29830 type:complete len:152 (-) Transcript_19649:35-490(-)
MILLLFSLLLGVVCSMLLFGISWTIVEYFRMRGWTQVTATVMQTELKDHRDGDSDLFSELTAKYQYVYEGQKYVGTRVGLHNGHNGPSNNKRAYQELSEYQQSGEPFRCFIDPKRPSKSVLYRYICWQKLLSVVFFAVVTGGFSLWIMSRM